MRLQERRRIGEILRMLGVLHRKIELEFLQHCIECLIDLGAHCLWWCTFCLWWTAIKLLSTLKSWRGENGRGLEERMMDKNCGINQSKCGWVEEEKELEGSLLTSDRASNRTCCTLSSVRSSGSTSARTCNHHLPLPLELLPLSPPPYSLTPKTLDFSFQFSNPNLEAPWRFSSLPELEEDTLLYTFLDLFNRNGREEEEEEEEQLVQHGGAEPKLQFSKICLWLHTAKLDMVAVCWRTKPQTPKNALLNPSLLALPRCVEKNFEDKRRFTLGPD